jgi:hypothetical protein
MGQGRAVFQAGGAAQRRTRRDIGDNRITPRRARRPPGQRRLPPPPSNDTPMPPLRHALAALGLACACAAHAQRVPAPAPAEPEPPPPPPPSEVLQSWRTGNGWITELRRHPDGTRSCATAKSFVDKGFGLFMLRSGSVTLFAVVDQRQPFTGPAELRLVQGARALGTFDAQAQGPVLATVDLLSRQVKAAIDKLERDPLDIEAAGRHFVADMTGVDKARAQFDSCALAVDLGKPGR